MAERGLRQVEMRGGGAEAAPLGDADEGLKSQHVDSHGGLRSSGGSFPGEPVPATGLAEPGGAEQRAEDQDAGY
ncbi:hypothetical protein GCM10028812_03220 [Ancylobacter sonchi]